MTSRQNSPAHAAAAMYYPSFRHAPWFLRFAFPLMVAVSVLGAFLLTSSTWTVEFIFGVVFTATSTVGLSGYALLYLPVATWLRIGPRGITHSVGFWRSALPWDRVREVRIVSMDRVVLPEVVIEIVPQSDGGRRSRGWLLLRSLKIDARLFGWAPDALAQEMDEWRARNVTA